LYSALKQVSWADRGRARVPLVEMHMRSEAAEAAPKAQQQPQLDWSRMSPMTVAQDAQSGLVAESNVSGMESADPVKRGAWAKISSLTSSARAFRILCWSSMFLTPRRFRKPWLFWRSATALARREAATANFIMEWRWVGERGEGGWPYLAI
jgi:hypothetical protein